MRKLALLGLLLLGMPAAAAAEAIFVLQAEGEGFRDLTPVASVGGNQATTLGAQRLAAVRHAADKWGMLLDSEVPVVVRVRFSSLGCTETEAVLAHGGAAKLLRRVPAQGVDPEVWYPAALANRLAGYDLTPGQPDILMEINSDVDDVCRDSAGGWYYGLDGARGGDTDLVETVMHELAHGLGFSSSVDPESGASILPSGYDAFTTHVVDVSSGKSWAQLSESARRQSARTPRGLAFSGARTQRSAAGVLRSGVDGAGRPLLYASETVNPGSSVSHFDPLARPDLLMEPFARRRATHEVDLTLAVLADMGWTSSCGNGLLDPGEECDDGERNGSRTGASCRASCRRVRCGDGVLDVGEECDEGASNDDLTPGACRTSCREAYCGDGVPDPGERCDGTLGCPTSCGLERFAGPAGASPLGPESAPGGPPSSVRRRDGCALAPPRADGGAGALCLLALALVLRRAGRAGRRA